jgi:hypothetical protein
MVPQGLDAQDTDQLTPLLLASFVNVALRDALPLPNTVGDTGATVTTTEGTSRVAEEDLLGSVADVPVRSTVMLLAGGVTGAV